MFEGQPKGLYALALANTGERFGYYTMLAIFTLFLQAKFGFSAAEAGQFYSIFLAGVYFLPMVGGILADKFGYGKMVTIGIFIMFLGYALLAIPTGADTMGLAMMIGALALIALGTGLFKGNLQVMVGNLYDESKYSTRRDSGFSLFYMAINIGAMFAPTAATAVTNWILGKANLSYHARIPELAHNFLDGTITPENLATLGRLQAEQGYVGPMPEFCQVYLDQLSQAYHYGFAVACISLIASIAIYYGFRGTFKHADYNAKTQPKTGDVAVEELTPKQTKDRLVALVLVYIVVLFFWMAFHQNGATLTFFARDYTQPFATGFMSLGISVWNLAVAAIAVYALFGIFQNKKKVVPAIISVACLAFLVYQYIGLPESTPILPQIFQQFNPFFVVALTPVSMAVFSSLAKKGKEPSAPRKIGLGMLIAALGFVIMAVASIGQPNPTALSAGAEANLVSPNWLISTYLVLTFGELLLSPMGISFVTKVAPPKYKGLMMGGWFAATAIGNYLTVIGPTLWDKNIPLWVLWAVMIGVCLVSLIFIFSIMKKLEEVAK